MYRRLVRRRANRAARRVRRDRLPGLQLPRWPAPCGGSASRSSTTSRRSCGRGAAGACARCARSPIASSSSSRSSRRSTARPATPATFVGHPLVDLAHASTSARGVPAGGSASTPARPVVALLPGSRPNEVRQILADDRRGAAAASRRTCPACSSCSRARRASPTRCSRRWPRRARSDRGRRGRDRRRAGVGATPCDRVGHRDGAGRHPRVPDGHRLPGGAADATRSAGASCTWTRSAW